jgi:Tfp pilus assembly protein PilZ
MLIQRRKYPRVKVSFQIEWGKTEECEHHGDKVTRLSAGGCFVQTEKEVERDETVFLRLWETPHGGNILEGRVIYQFRISPQFPPIGMGIEFVALHDEDESHLEHLLEFYNESSATLLTSETVSAPLI